MNRPMLTCAFAVLACFAVNAQQSTPSDRYQGQSHPPSDDTITIPSPPPQAKPPAGKPLAQAPPEPPVNASTASTPAPPAEPKAQPTSVDPSANPADPDAGGTDNGTVQVAPASGAMASAQPELSARADEYASGPGRDPDGDIVHPHPDGPGVLGAGATIRALLLTLLSTADSQRGQEFRTRVATDVVQDGQVLIPAGAEIDGRVMEVSSGRTGGHGSMRLRPETVILADGTRYRLDAQVTGTPGSNTRVSGEGVINAGTRYKKAGIQYGVAVGGGAAAGAFIGGPVGALTGGLIGAGAITVHLLVDHPQAVLEPGTVLIFTLSDRLNLKPEPSSGD